MEYANDRCDPGGIVAGSRQIYLTFPAESTFTEQDVSHYFKKYNEKVQHPMYYSPHFIDGDSEFHHLPRVCDNSRLLRKQLVEEHEQALEFERRRLTEFQFVTKPLTHHPYFSYSMDELKLSEEQTDQFTPAEHFSYLLDVLNGDSTNDEKFKHTSTNFNDQGSSQGLNLPESPFASPIGNNISTII